MALTLDAPPLRAQKAPGELVDPRDGGLEVAMGEWAIALEADAIRPGEVTFVIHNRGTRTHGFRIRSRSHGHGRGRDRFERRTRLIPPGTDAELTVSLQSGVYRVQCFVEEPDVGDHDDLGMEATLTVRADAPLVPARTEAPPSTVEIERFEFSPPVLKVAPGTTVTWRNRDPAEHTVTAEDGSFESQRLASGATFTRRFDTVGVFSYGCTLHPMMSGRIEVVEGAGGPSSPR